MLLLSVADCCLSIVVGCTLAAVVAAVAGFGVAACLLALLLHGFVIIFMAAALANYLYWSVVVKKTMIVVNNHTHTNYGYWLL